MSDAGLGSAPFQRPQSSTALLADPMNALRALAILSLLFGGIWVDVLGFPVNIERFVSLAGLMLAPIALVRSTLPIKLLVAWYAVMAIAMMMAPNSSALINNFAVCLVPLGIFSFFQNSLGGRELSEKLVRFLVFLVSIVAPLMYIAAISGASWASIVLDVGRSRFFAIEANLFGAASVCVTLLFVPYMRSWLDRLLFVLCLVSIFFSYSRGPYLALAVGLIVYMGVMGDYKRPIVIATIGAAAFFTLIYFFAFSSDQMLPESFGRASTIRSRAFVIMLAWQNIEQSPFFGRGPLEFGVSHAGLNYIFGSASEQTVWISQMFVSILHDTGFIGLSIYLVFLGAVLRQGYQAAKQATNRRVRASYLAAFVALLVVSQATTLHLTGLFAAMAALTALPIRRGMFLPAVRSVSRGG